MPAPSTAQSQKRIASAHSPTKAYEMNIPRRELKIFRIEIKTIKQKKEMGNSKQPLILLRIHQTQSYRGNRTRMNLMKNPRLK